MNAQWRGFTYRQQANAATAAIPTIASKYHDGIEKAAQKS